MNIYAYLLANLSKGAAKVVRMNVVGYTRFLSDERISDHYVGQGRAAEIDAIAEGLLANGWDWNDREDGRDVLVTAARPEVQIRIERVGKTKKRWYFEARSPRFTGVQR